jgi:phage protein D
MGNGTVNVPNFRIFVNGNRLADDLYIDVRGVTVEDEINLPTMFAIKMSIVNSRSRDWHSIDMKDFKPGDEIKVMMGMDKPQDMVTGELTSMDVTFGGDCVMELRGYDRLHRMRFGKKRRSFKDMKDSDIAAAIGKEAGLTPQTEDTGTVHSYIFQNEQSNFEFLLERARRIGYEMLVADKQFMFRKSQENKAAVLTMKYALDFDSFSVQLNTLTEGNEVEVRGWNVKDKKEITAKAADGSETTIMGGKESGYKITQSGFGDAKIAVTGELVADQAEAGNIAKAKYNSLLKNFIKGEGSCSGNPLIRAGAAIELTGLGERFSGVYYVVSTVHSINEDGYKTIFKVKRTGI